MCLYRVVLQHVLCLGVQAWEGRIHVWAGQQEPGRGEVHAEAGAAV